MGIIVADPREDRSFLCVASCERGHHHGGTMCKERMLPLDSNISNSVYSEEKLRKSLRGSPPEEKRRGEKVMVKMLGWVRDRWLTELSPTLTTAVVGQEQELRALWEQE